MSFFTNFESYIKKESWYRVFCNYVYMQIVWHCKFEISIVWNESINICLIMTTIALFDLGQNTVTTFTTLLNLHE